MIAPPTERGGTMRIFTTSGGRVRASRRARRLIAGVVLAAAASVVLGAGARRLRPIARNSRVDWNKHALDALANPPTVPTPGAGMAPPVQAIHMAMVQGAVYDAVNSIARGSEAYLAVPPHAVGLPGSRDRHSCARRAGLGAESDAAVADVHRGGSADDHRPSRPARDRVARGSNGRRRRRGVTAGIGAGEGRGRSHDRRPPRATAAGARSVSRAVRRPASGARSPRWLHDALGPE